LLRLLAVFLLSTPLLGQNSVVQSWPANEISSLQLQLPYANRIEIIGESRTTIEAEYLAEGEYQNDLRLNALLQKEQLILTEQLSPSFNPYHDKLSAHKVMASTLKLTVPEKIALSLAVENAQTLLIGIIKQLEVKQNEGNVSLESAALEGQIWTNKANIQLDDTLQGVFAASKKGKLVGGFTSKEKARLLLYSNSGNISRLSKRK